MGSGGEEGVECDRLPPLVAPVGNDHGEMLQESVISTLSEHAARIYTKAHGDFVSSPPTSFRLGAPPGVSLVLSLFEVPVPVFVPISVISSVITYSTGQLYPKHTQRGEYETNRHAFARGENNGILRIKSQGSLDLLDGYRRGQAPREGAARIESVPEGNVSCPVQCKG